MAATTTGDVEYLDAQQVRRRYGARSAMWLWRCRQSEPDFPKPIKLHGRNYWRYRDLIAFEQKRARAK